MHFFPTLSSTTQALALALGVGSVALQAHAVLPSAEVLVHFTGNQAGGGNGASPSRVLSEAADGYLYGGTATGGGTDADLGTGGAAGNEGGRGQAFYRIRNDGSDFGLVANSPATMPTWAYTGGWRTGSDGALYAPNGTSSGPALYRFVPGGTEWTTFGPSGSNTGSSALAVTAGKFIVRRSTSSQPLRAIGIDGQQTVLLTPASRTGANPSYMLTDTDGTVYGINASGSSNGEGSLFRLVTNGTAAGTSVSLMCGFLGSTTGRSSTLAPRNIAVTDTHVYGATAGGPLNGGVFWRIPKTATTTASCPALEILHSFSTGDVLGGAYPSHLVTGDDGNIYGISQGGIGLDGTPASGHVFRYRIAGNTDRVEGLEVLHSFSGTLPDPARNNVYTDSGGNTATSTINVGANAGGHTPSSLMKASNGLVFGTTTLGGSHGWGTLFAFRAGDEVPPDATIRPPEPHVILGIGALNARNSSTTMVLGATTQLYWSGVLSDNCVASSTEPGSSWSGPRATEARFSHAAEAIKPAATGTWSYTLSCTPTTGGSTTPVSTSVTVNVVNTVAQAQEVGNGAGGGALTGWQLLPLAALAALAGLAASGRHRRAPGRGR